MIKALVLLAAAVVLIAIVLAFIIYPLVEVWGQARSIRNPRRHRYRRDPVPPPSTPR